ncbi:MAG: alpha/beta hydrolase [Candidatus Polarisedimenticolia bacterium]
MLPLDRPGDPVRDAPLFQAHVRRCVEVWRGQGVPLDALTTEENADDVESLRIALGAQRLILLGGSYGSHLAFAVLRRHPASVERIALFGIEGPDHTLKRPALVDEILGRLAGLIASDPFYGRALPDPVASLRALAQRLAGRPASVQVEGQTVVVGDWDLRKRIADSMGRNGPMRQLPAAIAAMERGDFTDLARWAESWRRGTQWSAMALVMDCASWASPGRLELIGREARTSLVGSTVDFPFPDICDGLPIPRLGEDFRAPLRSLIPALFVTGDLDARTPPANADEMARGFPSAHRVIVANAGHGIIGYPQINPVMLDFLRGASGLPREVAFPKVAFTLPDPPEPVRQE